jgi:PEP-CTERM motif
MVKRNAALWSVCCLMTALVLPRLGADAITITGGSLQVDQIGGGKSGLTATVNLAEFESLWSVRSVRYDFSGPEPVPEPGTTLMVGFGTAAIVGRLSGRHCGSSQPSGTA